MKSQTANCIILGHKNFGEFDKLIFLYSEEFGKIKVIAKGARKITSKFTGHLETLNICVASLYFGPRNIILTEIATIKNFKEIREDLEKLRSALQIAEITNQIVYENQSLDNLSELIEQTIHHLCTSKKSSLIAHSYMIKFLDKVGIIPDFKTNRAFQEQPTEEKYLKFFHFIKTKPLDQIEKIQLTKKEETQIKKLIKNLVETETEKPMNFWTQPPSIQQKQSFHDPKNPINDK